MPATIKDVAERAGVSLKTVSRVINHEASVQDDTRARVQKAIEELNYQPDLSARSLRGARNFALGLVYDNPNPYYIIAVQNGALSVCREMGFGLQIHPCDSTAPKLAQELTDLAHRSRLAGLVLAPPMSEDPKLIRHLAKAGVHFVRILSAAEDPDDGYPCVFIDDRDAAYDITEHLIQLGHTRIGFLWGGEEHRSSPERYKGYADALKDYGIEQDRKLVVKGDYSFDDGFRGARKLLALKEPPTAIFGSNDEIAAGVLAAAKSAGMDVPYDLSIAGFEDSPFSKQSWPALTTARQATDEIAQHATRLLIAQLQKNGRFEVHNEGFSPELVVRGSTAPPRPRK
ncbi:MULTISPECIES: LacI family DNA-binding transcriptional regulator [Oleiagrimonas]|uniref:LacI family transcriptional regulator n=1 Tax=Oleiagrimonas citrea TaxID=1665687 RepID=A0A846ZM04_9GAMM|nr:LacI family DNA-binding transcriptional regulator [Oleiagrimonas sp. MCCC 1A03011]NKZ38996.1 LacI family transcriptional regulator [Oleiagrimonas citrea]RAP57642.1 LacI family transcriptional regulator [Oleiagrimonas sp. MCCC 1A03011]